MSGRPPKKKFSVLRKIQNITSAYKFGLCLNFVYKEIHNLSNRQDKSKVQQNIQTADRRTDRQTDQLTVTPFPGSAMSLLMLPLLVLLVRAQQGEPLGAGPPISHPKPAGRSTNLSNPERSYGSMPLPTGTPSIVDIFIPEYP